MNNKNKLASSSRPTGPEEDKDLARRELRSNQVVGVFAGLLAGWMTGTFWPDIPASMPFGWGGVLIWGAAIGAILGSLPQLARVGKIVTRRDNSIINTLVSLSALLLVILILAIIFR